LTEELSNMLARTLSDRRNLTILILFIITAMLTLAFAVFIGAYSVTHEASPYELRSDAEATFQESRDQMNVELANQHAVNANVEKQLVAVTDRLDKIDDDILQAAGMPSRRHKKK
jgi:endonuclease/exonuclease/phosphatase (EEP) superfamily protein YafD